MQEKMKYKGREIQAVPHQNLDSGKWTTKLRIVRSTGDKVKYSPFYTKNGWQTKDEAIQACFAIGKRIIDGEVKATGWTISEGT